MFMQRFFPRSAAQLNCASTSWLTSPMVVLLGVLPSLLGELWMKHAHSRWFYVCLLSSTAIFCKRSVSSSPCMSGNLRERGKGPRWWHKACVKPAEWIMKGYSTWDYQTYYYVKSDYLANAAALFFKTDGLLSGSNFWCKQTSEEEAWLHLRTFLFL